MTLRVTCQIHNGSENTAITSFRLLESKLNTKSHAATLTARPGKCAAGVGRLVRYGICMRI